MIAVRVLRDGVPIREQVLRSLPFRIGRGAECEVILSDDSVSRVHARVSAGEDGVPQLEDAGSRNGLHSGPIPIERVAVTARVRCRLGRVELELEPVSEATTQEIDVGEWRRYDQRRSGLHALGYLASAVAAWLAVEAASPAFWSPLRERRGLHLAGQALGAAMAVGLGGFVLLVGMRAVGRRVRIADALQALARVAWLWPAAALLGYLSYYLFSPATHASLVAWIDGIATVATVAILASVRRTGRRLGFALAWGLAAGVLYAALGLTEAAEQTASGAADADYSLQAPLAGWTGPAGDPDAYFARVEAALEKTERSLDE